MSSAAPTLDEPDDEAVARMPYPARDWFIAHHTELRQKYGKGARVAISPARGVVASGTLPEVQAQLDAMGEPREDSDVVIFVVR